MCPYVQSYFGTPPTSVAKLAEGKFGSHPKGPREAVGSRMAGSR